MYIILKSHIFHNTFELKTLILLQISYNSNLANLANRVGTLPPLEIV